MTTKSEQRRLKIQKPKKDPYEHLLIKEYWDDITYKNEKTGEIVTQRVLVKKYGTAKACPSIDDVAVIDSDVEFEEEEE